LDNACENRNIGSSACGAQRRAQLRAQWTFTWEDLSMAVCDLKGYMGGRYLVVNRALRTGEVRSGLGQGDGLNDMEKSVLIIDKDLDSLARPVAPGTVVYRQCGKHAKFGVHKKGYVATDLAYLSTSQNAAKYKFGNVKEAEGQMFFTIVCMTHGLGRDVVHVRGNYQEQEVIFHRKTLFKLTEVEKDGRDNVHWLLQEMTSPDAGYVWGAQKT